MKLKIALFTCISLPVCSSEPTTTPNFVHKKQDEVVTKLAMPDYGTILAKLSSNNESSTFKNPEHRKAIAATLANKILSRKEIITCMQTITGSSDTHDTSITADYLIQGVPMLLVHSRN